MTLLRIDETVDELESRLVKAGFSVGAPSFEVAWGVYKSFAAAEIYCARRSWLFDYGIYNRRGEQRVCVWLTSVFWLDHDLDHARHLNIFFHAPLANELSPLANEKDHWCHDPAAVHQFFGRIENSAPLRAAIKYCNWSASISLMNPDRDADSEVDFTW